MDGQRKRENTDSGAPEKAGWKEMGKGLQGYAVFGGSSVVVCGGPVLQWGGALRRINGWGLW